ncbi:MAG TPA: hypothetical protein VLG13_01700 [Patescibacteria group bacterium]|nr:hypothetical protein [Patescibacteria group bacterium]
MTVLDSGQPPLDYVQLGRVLQAARSDTELFKQIVNAPFEYNKVETAFLFLGIMVLLLVNKQTGQIDRVALSNTELAKNTTEVSYVPFEAIKIPVDHPENIISRAIQTGKPQETVDWKDLFVPALTEEQARINQAGGGIAYSGVQPLKARDGGAMIFSFYQYPDNISKPQHEFMERYAALVTEALRR